MDSYIFSVLFLILAVESECSTSDRFFISAPHTFHMGVNEKVFVQMGTAHVNNLITLYLEHESSSTVVSEKKTILCSNEQEIKTVELMIDREMVSRVRQARELRYLKLVAESPSFSDRKSTNILVSNHRGYIFIQTDQPIYNPTQKVRYRIFTLDHTLRPSEDVIQIGIFNALGNRVMTSLNIAKGGIHQSIFPIPDVSKMGTWRITAHYEDDEQHAASREFKVQKFVLPSFEVNIAVDNNYILVNTEQFTFSIFARYSHGENVKGAYHCQVGVVEKATTNVQKPESLFIRRMELTGSVKDGTAAASLQMSELNVQLQKQRGETLAELQQRGAQLHLRVFVTNIQSGEIQEAEVYLPIISHKYTMDLSRTRSYFVPGYPLDVVVVMRHPDGSPAAGVPVKIDIVSQKPWQGTTDQEGAVSPVFNIPSQTTVTVHVSTDGLQQSKVIQRASSRSGSYLYISFTQKIYNVKELLSVTYNTNGQNQGFIYYMVLSRGNLVKGGSLRIGTSVRDDLRITADMVPSFRLIGYYYNNQGDIVADSVWVDVRDECEIKVKVEHKGQVEPGKTATLQFDLDGQKARVALLAVDKAIYALNVNNKLTDKQVFSSMRSYDLGCSYGGGFDAASVLKDAGLSFVSQSQSERRNSLGCHSQALRQKRAVDLQQEMLTLKSNFSGQKLQDCCVRGFSVIPMSRTCQERANRVSLVEANPSCAAAFLKCCLKGEALRQKKMQEDAENGLGRTASTSDIEQFFWDTTAQYIRRFFPPSVAFTAFDVNGKRSYPLTLPDSITTWEIQVVTLSPATGFCVVKPSEVRAFKKAFVSLRLPYSVKKYEQLSISPIIYNYGETRLEVAVHMGQTEGLCSPGSATTAGFVNITVEPTSSQLVSFTVVPTVSGSIPIKIRLYDMEEESGIDAVEKTLNVLAEGLEQTEAETNVHKLDGRSTKTFNLSGLLPDNRVPDTPTNIFISMEGDGFSSTRVKNLLSPETVARLIVLPTGCLEQTMVRLAPTASALRYLDLSDQWFNLPAGARDDALDKIETGYIRILTYKKRNGAYGAWGSVPSSNWVTGLVVKVLSLVAQRQTAAFGQQGRRARTVPVEQIRHSVSHLLSVQNADGSFTDPHPVLHRGLMHGKDQDASMTAFINLAMYRSLQFLDTELRNNVKASISRSTTYLLSCLEELQHPYAVAITAYCLAVCMPQGTDHSTAWTKLHTMAIEDKNRCVLLTANASPENQAHADAVTVETTAYALLAAVELGHTQWADRTACWLTTQENHFGGFRSSQDTIMALEALAEYELKKPTRPELNMLAEFTIQGRPDIVRLALDNANQKVETDLEKFSGNTINVQLTGTGNTKLKIVKVYHVMDPNDHCNQVSISVTVEGKVKYTAKVIENYEYYDDYENNEKEVRVPRSAIEWFDARTRNRRDLDDNTNSDQTITYRVCVSHSVNNNLTGMAIADITLLSGFEAVTQDLERLKELPERYITHYEVTHGRVLLYFHELYEKTECISFDAIQIVPIGLLQPAPAVFYDYYEPYRKCTVFYSAPQRSKMVSKLCSEDVCQCAERPCHTLQNTFQSQVASRKPPHITKDERFQHACFFPTVDYAYIGEVLNVTLKSNFELYTMSINNVLRSHGDLPVSDNSIRVFAKRRQCKGQLDLGKQYLIMGKDGSTTDSNGHMRYLLESNTWVERKPSDCLKSGRRTGCRAFNLFTEEYKIDGCLQ